MGNGKFDPLPPPNPLTDRHKKLHTWLRPGYCDPSRGFFSPYARNCASKCLLGFFFSGFFQQPTAYALEPIFTRNTSNDAVPRKDVPFRGYKTKF